MSIIGFPEVVDERAARTVATGVVVLTALALATRWPVVVALLVVGFAARVLSGPRFSPLALLATRVVVPRLHGAPRPVAGTPKRFAQAMGLTFSSVALVLLLVDASTAALVVLTMLLVAAGLEASIGLCLGCKVFALLARAGIVDADDCERCVA
ncbi:MAG: hypothetical protein QOD30_421 [Actinomycetota bacterium]|jgi:hypothetical protein|nr:hypothetical protein [Actinomycetota bacterium]